MDITLHADDSNPWECFLDDSLFSNRSDIGNSFIQCRNTAIFVDTVLLFPPERRPSCTHRRVSPPCTSPTRPAGLTHFAFAIRSPLRPFPPRLQEKEIVLQRHTTAISTSNEYELATRRHRMKR